MDPCAAAALGRHVRAPREKRAGSGRLNAPARPRARARTRQGQTTYGGLSAALCLEGARRLLSEAQPAGAAPPPPLRSATISFVGAAGGAVDVDASVLRQGKAVAFVNSVLLAEGKRGGKAAATSGTFLFGAARPQSSVDARLLLAPPPPALPGPESCGALFGGGWTAPVFTQHFEARLAAGALPGTGAPTADLFVWVRHEGADEQSGRVDSVAGEVALLALADMLPPAACSLFPHEAPVSSATWHINILAAAPRPYPGGWWLLRTRCEHAHHGYSSQDMELWGRNGCAAVGRQCVAIYA